MSLDGTCAVMMYQNSLSSVVQGDIEPSINIQYNTVQ